MEARTIGILLNCFKFVIFMTCFIVAVHFIVKGQREEDRQIYKSWLKTVGRIIKTSSRKSGEYGTVAFHVNNKRYVEEYDFYDPIIGNCYVVYYDSVNPGDYSIVNEAEQLCLSHPQNEDVYTSDFEVDDDTTPYGWHRIDYNYIYNGKDYSGYRYIKHEYYRKERPGSLLVAVHPNVPAASYVFWPWGSTLYCIKRNGIIGFY